ncbi:MAG: DivIVA domain-containing protein [Leucobacter sp.]
MALTPEDVLNQRFTITKFRDGYDLEQVDDFLDVIVEELRQHEQAKEELRAEVEELTAKLEAAESTRDAATEATPSSEEPVSSEEAADRTIVVDAPKPAAPEQAAPTSEAAAFSAGAQGDAVKSSAMLQLALELHDKHIHEGEAKRDQLVTDAESTAKRLIEDAQKQRADELRLLGDERSGLQGKIRELRDFEREYRSTLRSYIQSQLRGLDGSPEPDGAPEGLQ